MTDFRQEMAIAILLGAAFCGAAVGMDECAKYYQNRTPQERAESQRQAERDLVKFTKAYERRYDLKGCLEHFVDYFND